MKRVTYFLFGVACHALFLLTFAYMILFIGGFWVSKTIDGPRHEGSVAAAVAIDLALLAAFGLSHSVMARPAFKRWWTRYVPAVLERSVYVLVSCAVVILMMWLWRPIGPTLWAFDGPVGRALMYTLFAAGWLLVPAASLMISHFDLFGTRQVWLYLRGQAYTHLPFRVPMAYKVIRHPLYVGWIVAFWAASVMTVGHALFAAVLTAYILAAIPLEERDLVASLGSDYENYRRRVPALVPALPGRNRDTTQAAEPSVPQVQA
jgi:methanethiol S-methyltransferase